MEAKKTVTRFQVKERDTRFEPKMKGRHQIWAKRDGCQIFEPKKTMYQIWAKDERHVPDWACLAPYEWALCSPMLTWGQAPAVRGLPTLLALSRSASLSKTLVPKIDGQSTGQWSSVDKLPSSERANGSRFLYHTRHTMLPLQNSQTVAMFIILF